MTREEIEAQVEAWVKLAPHDIELTFGWFRPEIVHVTVFYGVGECQRYEINKSQFGVYEKLMSERLMPFKIAFT